MWERPFWEGVWLYLDPWDSVRLRTASTRWNVPVKCGPHGELFFFLIKKEQVVTSNEVLPNPIVSADMLTACALIGLHLMAAEDEPGSSGCLLTWETRGDAVVLKALTGTATLSHGLKAKALLLLSSANTTWKPCSACHGARTVRGKISLFLEDWELARVALSFRMALDMLCQGKHEAW